MPRKGAVPPQLRRFLFKKGRKGRTAKRRAARGERMPRGRKKRRGGGGRRRYFRKQETHGIMETILYGTAAADLFLAPDSSGYSVVTDIIATFQDRNPANLSNIPGHIVNAAMSESVWLPLGLGLGVDILSRVFHLRRRTKVSRKWSVL